MFAQFALILALGLGLASAAGKYVVNSKSLYHFVQANHFVIHPPTTEKWPGI